MDSPSFAIACECKNEADTAGLAAHLARIATPGDMVILEGALAAGKTHFIKYLCDKLNILDTVTSPTFTLAHFYAGPIMPVLHVDAYRIETEHEFKDLTLEDFFEDHLTVIEWGGKFLAALPPALIIQIDPSPASETARRITFSSDADCWCDRAKKIQDAVRSIEA